MPSAIQKGLLEAQRAGDLDALHFNFPVIITEHVPPGHDPNNPNGVCEAKHEPFPFKLLKELKQAVQNYGVNSPFTTGIIQGITEGNRLFPTDWSLLAKTVPSPSEFLQFKTRWQDHAEAAAAHNRARNVPISME